MNTMKSNLAFSILILSLLLLVNEKISGEEIFFQQNRKGARGINSILLKSRIINFEKKLFDMENSEKRIYIKFRKTLDSSVLSQLNKYNLYLEDYITDNTYIVKLDSYKLDILKKKNFIQGFSHILPQDKMSENLYNNKLGDWCIVGTDVKIIISCYKAANYNTVLWELNNLDCTIQSDRFHDSRKIYGSVNKDYISDIAELDCVKYVEEISPPSIIESIEAGKLSSVFWEDSGLKSLANIPYGLTGENIGIAIRDEGKVFNHQDFEERVQNIDNEGEFSSHATILAGIIGGKQDFSTTPKIGGMAPKTTLYILDYNNSSGSTETDFIPDFNKALTLDNCGIIHNSYGLAIGWNDAGDNFINNQDLFGRYTSDTEKMDDFIYKHFDNDSLVIISAGNHRDDDGDNDSPHDGTLLSGEYYFTVGPLGSSKNAITVGSIGGNGLSDNESSLFSSWGPTKDGRIKPDVVADGYEIRAIQTGTTYGMSSGTSLSAAVVTGISALIYEAYNEQYNTQPTADIVKALLCNYADPLGPCGPDFRYGFGVINAEATIQGILNYDQSSGGHILTGIIGESTDSIEYQFTLKEGVNYNLPIVITLVWIDPPATPAATNSIVNDLDVRVYTNDGNTFLPYYFKEYDDSPLLEAPESSVDPTTTAKRGSNRYDTIEQISIGEDNDSPLYLGTYYVRISGHRIPEFNQHFALVSSIGFDGFNFNSLKIKSEYDEWVNNNRTILNKTPDVLLQITEFSDGFDPSTLEYSYSTDGGENWSSWNSVTGVFENDNCTTEITTTYSGIAFAKQENIPFNKVSLSDNKIKFRVYYDNNTLESIAYLIRNHNTYHVSIESGDDHEGNGTQINPWKTINYAISVVDSLSTQNVPSIILVQEGTYNEDIILEEFVYLYGGYNDNWGKNISDSETIINGSGTTHVLIGSDNAIIDGFTITGGEADNGGGVYLYETSPSISNCTIKNNLAYNTDNAPNGGGIYAYKSSSSIIKCRIMSNSVDSNNHSVAGGGIYAQESSLTIEDSTIDSNVITSSTNARGGGLFLLSDSSIIINSSISKNKINTDDEGLGGAMYCSDATTKLLGSIVYSNENNDFFNGEAIYFNNSSNAIITNCTIYNNSPQGIRVGSGNCTIYNSILWANDDDIASSNILLRYCCIEDGDDNGNNGNIADNPDFVDQNNDNFHLKNISPCIDAGLNSANGVSAIGNDMDKEKRIYNFLNSSIDIGADEYHWTIQSLEFNSQNGLEMAWDSMDNETYYVEYTDNSLSSPFPILHYKLNDNSTTHTVIENISSNNNGTLISNGGGSSAYTEDHSTANLSNYSGKINNALYFDNDDYINCGDVANLTENFSFAFWAYLDEDIASDDRNIINKGSNGSWRIRVDNSTSKLRMILKVTSYVFNFTFPGEQWKHVVVLVNTSAGEMKLYVDSALEDTQSIPATALQSTNNAFVIGALASGNESWLGTIDDVRIYDKLLSDKDIKALYNNNVGTEKLAPEFWKRVTAGISSQGQTTSWNDNGNETSQAPDNDSLQQRFYRIVKDF